LPGDEPKDGQRLQGFANRGASDAEYRTEAPLGGQSFAGLQFTTSDLLLKIASDLVDTAVKLDHGQTKISLTPQIRLLYSKTRQLWPDQFPVVSERGFVKWI
jgi:hypothetical protein